EKGGDANSPDAQGIRAASFSDVARRASAYPRPHPGSGLGTGIRRRVGVSPYFCPATKEKTRRRRRLSQIPSYRFPGWLPIQSGGRYGVWRPGMRSIYIRVTSSCLPHESCSILDSVAKSIDSCSAVTPLATRWTEPPP